VQRRTSTAIGRSVRSSLTRRVRRRWLDWCREGVTAVRTGTTTVRLNVWRMISATPYTHPPSGALQKDIYRSRKFSCCTPPRNTVTLTLHGGAPPSYLGRITPRRIMGDTTWSEIWKSQSVGSSLALNSSSNPPI
jgi:hypothetical protein